MQVVIKDDGNLQPTGQSYMSPLNPYHQPILHSKKKWLKLFSASKMLTNLPEAKELANGRSMTGNQRISIRLKLREHILLKNKNKKTDYNSLILFYICRAKGKTKGCFVLFL